MSEYLKAIKKETRPYLHSLYDDIKARRNKDFFWPTGTQVYCGRQGSGKTISAVKHIIAIKSRYPKAVIVSNIKLNNMRAIPCHTFLTTMQVTSALDTKKEYIQFDTIEQLSQLLVKVNNGHFGVVYVVDEIHTYFNALESSNIPMYVFTEISQQRKQRKLIIGTSQLFMRMAKPFREQCDNIITCRTFAGILTFTKAWDGMTIEQDYDGKLTGTLKKTGWYFHTRALRNSFDTFQKVVSGSEQYETVTKMQITENKKGLLFNKR